MAKESGRIKGMANLASLGIHLVVSTFIGLFLGIYLDGYFSTAPWLMILFFIFGLAAGFKNIFTAAKRYGFTDETDLTMEGEGGREKRGNGKSEDKSGNGDGKG